MFYFTKGVSYTNISIAKTGLIESKVFTFFFTRTGQVMGFSLQKFNLDVALFSQ